MPVKNSLISNSISSAVLPPTLSKKALCTWKIIILKAGWVFLGLREGWVICLFKDYEVTQGKQQHAWTQKLSSTTQLFHLVLASTLHKAGKPPAHSSCCQRSCLCSDKWQKGTQCLGGQENKMLCGSMGNYLHWDCLEPFWSHQNCLFTATKNRPNHRIFST